VVGRDASRAGAALDQAGGNGIAVAADVTVKEEADRAALTPEVAKDLRLPEDSSTLILDTYQGTPELVPLAQIDSELNRNTAHNILRAAINPLSAAHQIVTLKGERSDVQIHVAKPVLYLRIGDEAVAPTAGAPFTVDTHGATSAVKSGPGGGSPDSRDAGWKPRTRSLYHPPFRTGCDPEDVIPIKSHDFH